MAYSRLEKIGTIYSRITGLLRTGAIKLEDRPIWYEVYETFPPEQEPRFDRPISEIPITQIFYPEDIIRARFYKKVSYLPTINLNDDKRNTLSQKFIGVCLELQNQKGIALEEVFNEAFEKFKGELQVENLPQTKKETSKEGTISDIKHLNIKEILKES